MIGAILLSERLLRDGELTEQSLTDALASEVDAGRRPRVLAVSTSEMATRGLRILSSSSGLGMLRSSMGSVILDESLPLGSWELRPDG